MARNRMTARSGAWFFGGFVVMLGLLSCRTQPSIKEEPGVSRSVAITATVRAYVPNAIHDSFEDGGFQSFDASSIVVVAPAFMRGRELSVAHNAPEAEDSPWRRVGRQISFTIDRSLLGEDSLVFSAAAEDLRVVEP